MAWDGNGNFTRTNGTQSGAATWADADTAGNNITTTQHDTHDEDLADGIAACLTKNNESKPTATFKPNADASYDLGSTLLRWKDLFLSGDIAIGGGDLTTAATTFNLLAANATTVNAFGAASVALTIGHGSAAAKFLGGATVPNGTPYYVQDSFNVNQAGLAMTGGNLIQIGSGSRGVMGYSETNAAFIAQGAGRDGVFGIETTNNRWVFFANGNRYYISATATF